MGGGQARFPLVAAAGLLFWAIFCCVPLCAAEPPTQKLIRIGVLANRGFEQCLADWSGMIRAFEKDLPEHDFELVPLSFTQVEEAAATSRLDFLITNPAIYIDLEMRYGASRMATLVNHVDGASTSRFGGVFFTRAGKYPQATLESLKGKRLVATSPDSLGGWILGWSTLAKAGIDPWTDLGGLDFAGTHNKAVQYVLDGRADFGFTRTDTIERMIGDGRAAREQLKIITAPDFKADRSFPFVYSTELVPEWPFAKLAKTPENLAKKMAATLLRLHPLPEYGQGLGTDWTINLSYERTREIMRELRVRPFEEYGTISVQDFMQQHTRLVLVLIGFFMVLAASVAYLRKLNSRLRLAMGKLRDAEAELTHQANTDVLTGLRNRKRFNELVELEIGRAKRYKRPLAMLMLDLDHFKSVNDRFGHPVGDKVLVSTAHQIAGHVRNSDLAARIGGEEFAVLMPETGLDEAVRVAERIRQDVALSTLAEVSGDAVRCTVSIGVAELCGTLHSYSALYKAADQALYQAKNLGRDRVEMAKPGCGQASPGPGG